VNEIVVLLVVDTDIVPTVIVADKLRVTIFDTVIPSCVFTCILCEPGEIGVDIVAPPAELKLAGETLVDNLKSLM
jgi:hypothetical protein